MAQIIKTTGEVIEVAPKNGTDFSIEELQAIVSGYVEVIYLPDGRLILCDEDGRAKNKPYNHKATEEMHKALGGKLGAYRLGWYFGIVGDVLVCNENQIG